MGKPTLEFRDVYLGYRGEVILPSVNLVIEEGDFIGIVGPNGAGKTTLLRAIAGILKPLKGEIIIHKPNLAIGYVPQRSLLDETYPLTALEIVCMGLYRKVGLLRSVRKYIGKAREALRVVGLEGIEGKLYRELSGGQKQKVLLARALVSEPEILLLDEPITDLDVASQKSMMDFLSQLNKERGMTILLVSHLLDVVAERAEKIVMLGDGRVVSGKKEEILSPQMLKEFFGIPLGGD
ncbi:metal ABC transporter ATP-binding protein [bacterium]|nr:metal ABC transporter ATP-binding protein [bacterium]